MLCLRLGEGAVVVFWRFAGFAGFAMEEPLRFAMAESDVAVIVSPAVSMNGAWCSRVPKCR